MTGSRNCLLSTELTFHIRHCRPCITLSSFTLAKRKPRNCRKHSFIPNNQRIREWDEKQQMQPCQVLCPLQSLILNTRETTPEPNIHRRNCSSSQRKGGIAMQKKPALFFLNEAAGNQLSTTQIFQAKHLSKGEKHPHSPLESCIQRWLWHPDKAVHKTDEHTPFSTERTKRNQDNPSWEELHAAIKALIKY